jgi:hypothetical protein
LKRSAKMSSDADFEPSGENSSVQDSHEVFTKKMAGMHSMIDKARKMAASAKNSCDQTTVKVTADLAALENELSAQ